MKSAKCRDFTVNDVAFMSEEDAFEFFIQLRWGSRDQAVCPHCGSIHRHYYRKKQKQWRCRDCDDYFSVTTQTPLAYHKLGFKRILLGMMEYISSANGISNHALSRKMDVQQKTAQAFVGKMREVLCRIQSTDKLSGLVQIDGGYFGGRPRNGRVRRRNTPEQIAEHVQAKLNGKIRSNQPPRSKIGILNWKRRQKRRVVMVLRELYPEPGRGARRTIVHVCKSENELDAISLARHYVMDGASIMTDENPAYNRLSSWYKHETVQHSIEFSTIDGVNDNQAESYFSRLRRYVLGVSLRVEPKYLHDIATEMAWREDMRRETEGEKLRCLLTGFFKHGLSMWWRGYWQKRYRKGELLWQGRKGTMALI